MPPVPAPLTGLPSLPGFSLWGSLSSLPQLRDGYSLCPGKKQESGSFPGILCISFPFQTCSWQVFHVVSASSDVFCLPDSLFHFCPLIIILDISLCVYLYKAFLFPNLHSASPVLWLLGNPGVGVGVVDYLVISPKCSNSPF